jgi:hypothetical protein
MQPNNNTLYSLFIALLPPMALYPWLPVLIREFEQDNELRRRRRTWQFSRLHIILRILSWTSLVVAQCVFPCVAVYEYWPWFLPWPRKKQRDMKLYPVFVLLPSCITKFTSNFAKIFVVNEGRRTKTGYGLMSRCFVLMRVRIWVSILKQLGMNL